MIRIGALLALAATGAATPGESVNFIACPVAQDQGPDRDICFFAEHRGKRYGLSNPVDWGAPQLRHKVLVEGMVADRPADCGGVALDGRVSVMPELSPECDVIAPPVSSPPPPPGLPGARAQEVAAELAAIAADPARSLRAVPLRGVSAATAEVGRVETIYFPFESDRASGPDASRLVAIAQLAAQMPGAKIRIVATTGASRLDDGTILTERRGMARQRASKTADILKGLGADRVDFVVEARDGPIAPTAHEDWRSRRVEITVMTTTG